MYTRDGAGGGRDITNDSNGGKSVTTAKCISCGAGDRWVMVTVLVGDGS